MNPADPVVRVTPTEKAALLWDVPRLRAPYAGASQWLRALTFNFAPDWGEARPEQELDRSDSVSIAAHVVESMLMGKADESAELEVALIAHSDVGALFASAIRISLRESTADEGVSALRHLDFVLPRLDDHDLTARLSLRVAVWAQELGADDLIVPALRRAQQHTTIDDRLGVTARRWLARRGEESDGVSSWSAALTADDPLLSLPWVQADVLQASSSLAARRVEASLRGVHDTHWSIGRTPVDDLQAAHAQARWCADSALANQIELLLASEVLGGRDHPNLRAWAISTWARRERKGLLGAVRRFERDLEPGQAAALLDLLKHDPAVLPRIYWTLANIVWDILDEREAVALLTVAADYVGGGDVGDPGPRHVIGSMLWRIPDEWMGLVESSRERFTRMAGALDTSHVRAAPARLVELLAEWTDAPDAVEPVVACARFAMSGEQIQAIDGWSADQLVSVLLWRPHAVRPDLVAAQVSELLAASREELNRAHGGVWNVGAYDTRALLGHLAVFEAEPRLDAAEHLADVVRDPDASRDWQLGALEGLQSYVRKGVLPLAVAEALLAWPARAAVAHLGDENKDDSRVEAAVFSVAGDLLTPEHITQLAQLIRSPNAGVRVEAAAALVRAGARHGATRSWSLVSGLFDPQDEVAVRTLVELALLRDLRLDEEAMRVFAARLRTLFDDGARNIRRAVIALVRTHPDAFGSDLLDRAKQDPSWLVRKEAVETEPLL